MLIFNFDVFYMFRTKRFFPKLSPRFRNT